MEPFSKSMDDYLRASEDLSSNVLEMKMKELFAIKEELKKAKDDATQSWLDSRPLIDELEKLQTGLSNAKNQAAKSTTDISELESELKNIYINIKAKKEEEVKIQGTINQINQSSDKLRQEMQQIKLETDEEHRERSRLKQVMRLRKQTLQTLKLTLRAIWIESEAFAASSAMAHQHINFSETDNSTVQLTQDEYDALKTRAKKETSVADWKVSVAMEQRLLAEKSRELAGRSRSRKKKTRGEITDNEDIERQAEGWRVEVGGQVNSRHNSFPKARAKLIPQNQGDSQQIKRSKRSNKRTILQEKKPSIFVQIKTFLVRKITMWFG